VGQRVEAVHQQKKMDTHTYTRARTHKHTHIYTRTHTQTHTYTHTNTGTHVIMIWQLCHVLAPSWRGAPKVNCWSVCQSSTPAKLSHTLKSIKLTQTYIYTCTSAHTEHLQRQLRTHTHIHITHTWPSSDL